MENKTAVKEKRQAVRERIRTEEAQRLAMRVAFEKVQNRNHWKGEIDTVILATPEEIAEIGAAVIFYTATKATAKYLGGGLYRVTAPGYWRGSAA